MLDIRTGKAPQVNAIRFSDDPDDYGYATTLTRYYDDEDVFVDISNEDGTASVRILNRVDAVNLVLALGRAIELEWFGKEPKPIGPQNTQRSSMTDRLTDGD